MNTSDELLCQAGVPTGGQKTIANHVGYIGVSQCVIDETSIAERFCETSFNFLVGSIGDISVFAQKTEGSGQVKGVSALVTIEP